jgi:hypothetical protein
MDMAGYFQELRNVNQFSVESSNISILMSAAQAQGGKPRLLNFVTNNTNRHESKNGSTNSFVNIRAIRGKKEKTKPITYCRWRLFRWHMVWVFHVLLPYHIQTLQRFLSNPSPQAIRENRVHNQLHRMIHHDRNDTEVQHNRHRQTDHQRLLTASKRHRNSVLD